MLLEREREVARLGAALAGARGGAGAPGGVEGEPGIGKTALLRHAIEHAGATGFDVLTARGGELERGLTFGIARQLLERRAHEGERLFAGAARLAAPLLGVGEGAGETDEPALVHALFWVSANLASDGPVLLAVDDAQWADDASLRWLVYLARRLEELPVVLLAAVS